MNGYKFSLQNVLDWRREQEDEMKLKYIQTENEQQQQERYLQQLINENIHLKEKVAATKEINIMRQQDLYKEVLDEKIIQQRLVVDRAKQATKEAEEMLLNAYKDKKVMEKLKEKESEQYFEDLKHQEQQVLDEFATITFGREAYQ